MRGECSETLALAIECSKARGDELDEAMFTTALMSLHYTEDEIDTMLSE